MFDSYIIPNNSNIKQFCKQLKQAGFTGACFTEQISLPGDSLKKIPTKIYNDISIFNGADISFDAQTHEAIALSLAGAEYDLIINSVTAVDGIPLSKHEYYSTQSRNSAYSRYLEKVYDSLDAAYDYNLLGGLGLPAKYAYYPSPSLQFKEFPDILDTLLMRTVFSGKGLLVDASLFPKFGEPIPAKSILKRYKELGGELVTVGSFATAPEQAGVYIKAAHELLKSCGFKHHAIYSAGQPLMKAL